MATSMLHRFIVGYSVMLMFMTAVSGHSMYQLGRLSAAAHVALSIEQRMIDDAGKLADVFLSAVRYAGKFSATQAPVHYEQYKQFDADFDRYLKQLKGVATSADALQRLSRIEEYHAQYDQLFEREVRYIKIKQPYGETRYREEKDRLVDYLLKEQETFKSNVQSSLQQRIGYIERAAQQSQNLTLAATIFLWGMGIVSAFWLAGGLTSDWIDLVRARVATLALHCLPNWKRFGAQK